MKNALKLSHSLVAVDIIVIAKHPNELKEMVEELTEKKRKAELSANVLKTILITKIIKTKST